MKLAVMVEGQEGVTWEDWRTLAADAERLGYDALMRSDHYRSLEREQDRGALDAWGTINALGPLTERIRLGTLVSPVTFRPAAVLAKLALTADHTSGGRIDVGMGTGWNQGEHDDFGFTLPPMKERFGLLEQQVADVTRYWDAFEPRPVQDPRPHLILGGQAGPRAARLAARYADEYNLLFVDPQTAAERAKAIQTAARDARRHPLTVSMMIGFVVGRDEAEAADRRRAIEAWTGHENSGPWLEGTPEQIAEQLQAYEAAGLSRIMLQHHVHTDREALELLAPLNG